MNRLDNVNVLDADDTEPKVEEMEQDKFKAMNYVPQRFHPKYQKYAFIAIGIIVAVIFIALIVGFLSKSSNADIEGNGALTSFRNKLVVLINDTKLMSFDPKTRKLTLIYEAFKPVASFDVLADQRIYWIEMIDNTSTRLKAVVNNSISILIDDGRFEPRDMVLDHVTGNLYAIDEAVGNLIVVNIRTRDYALLMSELKRPHEIVLDPEDCLMFILQLSSSILRAKMDGTDITTIITNAGTTSLTLDPKRKRLYWINDFVNIESSDYEGRKRQIFFSDVVTINRLAILDDRLYWFWPGYGHPSNLLSCKFSLNDTCEEYTSYTMTNLGDPKYIRGYSSNHGMSIKNPCKVDNGGCQQLCLLNSKNMRSCACRMGWQMNPDKKSCREVRDFVLFPQGGFVRVKPIDGSSKDLVWPTPYKFNLIASKGEIDFDYDLANDYFYWSDDFHIFRMKLKTYENQSTILSVNASSMVIEDIAYDWYTSNMYFVQRSKTSLKRHSLMMFNVNLGESYQKTLYTYRYDTGFGLQACPYAMVLHPAKNSMFFTVGENEKRFIQHANMDGTNIHKIFNTFPAFVHEYRLIAIDYVKDRVYWIWDSDRVSVIRHAKFDGSDMKVISVDDIKDAKTIYVHQQWLYISNLTSIWRVHKETGNNAKRITTQMDDDKRKIAGVRVISESVQYSGKDNACAKANGGCSQFCLNIADGFNCDCKDGMNIRGFQCS